MSNTGRLHRVFFAITASPAFEQSLLHVQQRLPVLGGRPVAPANFHVTLVFVGEIRSKQLELLLDNIQPVALSPFKIETRQAVFWPKPGITGLTLKPSAALTQLHQSIRQQCARLMSLKKEKKAFTPHITLYRQVELMAEPPAIDVFSQMVHSFHLMESRFSSRGVSYSSLAEWPLTHQSVKSLLTGKN